MTDTYNTASEIKKLLLLEDENQTIEDEDIETYLEDAQLEMFSEIQRNRETDRIKLRSSDLNDDDEVEIVLFFKVDTDNGGVLEVRDETNHEVISSDNYELIRGNNAIKIKTGSDYADLDTGIIIEIDYIPVNYKLTERAIAISNILSRIAPFQNEQINPNLMTYREKQKNYIRFLKEKFGVGGYF
jgi:hypothetical protein